MWQTPRFRKQGPPLSLVLCSGSPVLPTHCHLDDNRFLSQKVSWVSGNANLRSAATTRAWFSSSPAMAGRERRQHIHRSTGNVRHARRDTSRTPGNADSVSASPDPFLRSSSMGAMRSSGDVAHISSRSFRSASSKECRTSCFQ